jgi:FlaA1/EpsC-like NDP-sugar epimerase
MKNQWKDKRVFITGVCGTVGRELLRQVHQQGPREIVGIDNSESELFFLREEYRDADELQLFLCDVRDRDQVIHRSRGMDIVLHSAALKHVIVCEQSPRDPVQTNILGTQNVIDAGFANEVERVLLTSSDKAVNPTNVMGTSKLMCERLMTAANAQRRGDGPIFASTRFGNVLGSRGSVIPLFKRQISQGGPVTVTDERMSRFIMTLEEAVALVMESVFLAQGGEVFVTKMPIVKISDLADVMIQEIAPCFGHDPSSVERRVIGSKAGEKLYEELMNDEETRRTVELPDYFAVLPAFKSVYGDVEYKYPGMQNGAGIEESYSSKTGTAMTPEELRSYLHTHKLLDVEAQ